MIVSGFVFVQPMGGPEANPHGHTFVAREAAEKGCGCRLYLGVRTDTMEPATYGTHCSPEHEDYMVEVVRDLHQSLDNPTDRPLIDVLDELLGE